MVADEIFTMGERQLFNTARLAVPNTLKESSMIVQSPTNRNNPNFQRPSSLYGNKLLEKEVQSEMINSGPCGTKDPMAAQVKKSELLR